MIIRRERNINPRVAEVSLQLSYTGADVRDFFKLWATHNFEELPQGIREQEEIDELFTREWVENCCWIFGNYEERWRVQLSAWLWCQFVEQGYLFQSSTRGNIYYLSKKGLGLIPPRPAHLDEPPYCDIKWQWQELAEEREKAKKQKEQPPKVTS